jgi:hypothetical protein
MEPAEVDLLSLQGEIEAAVRQRFPQAAAAPGAPQPANMGAAGWQFVLSNLPTILQILQGVLARRQQQ